MTLDEFKFELVSIIWAVQEKVPNQQIQVLCTDGNDKYLITSIGGKVNDKEVPEIQIGFYSKDIHEVSKCGDCLYGYVTGNDYYCKKQLPDNNNLSYNNWIIEYPDKCPMKEKSIKFTWSK